MTALPDFEAHLDRELHLTVITMQAEAEGRKKQVIEEFTKRPNGLLTWLSGALTFRDGFVGGYASTGEAAKHLEHKVKVLRSARDNQRWHLYDQNLLIACLERLEVARYFDEHGQRLWARRVEAA